MDTDIFNRFFQRLLVVALLPNILVWGFCEVGIDNDRNPLWFGLIGPYWRLEKLLGLTLLLVAGGFLLWIGLQLVLATIVKSTEDSQGSLSEVNYRREQTRKREEFEAEEWAKAKAYQALPKEEQDRINRERLEQVDLRWQQHMLECENKKLQQLAEDQWIRKEREAEIARRQTIQNSPDYQRRKALRDFTGGDLE